jgi:hypothetical protein
VCFSFEVCPRHPVTSGRVALPLHHPAVSGGRWLATALGWWAWASTLPRLSRLHDELWCGVFTIVLLAVRHCPCNCWTTGRQQPVQRGAQRRWSNMRHSSQAVLRREELHRG